MSSADNNPRRDWREIAQAASEEKDPKNLNELAEGLDQALEERDKRLRKEPSCR